MRNTTQVYQDGETIFAEGSLGNSVYLIDRGIVEISIIHDQARAVLSELHAGEIFGEMAMIDDQPRTATARAVGETELMVITQEQLKHRLDAMDPVFRLILTTILTRYRETLHRIKHEVVNFTPPAPAVLGGARPKDSGRAEALDRIRLEQDLKLGLIGKELFLHYQPIVALATETVVGFEALVRWNHPTRGFMPPDLFIATAEESDLVSALGRYVLSDACQGFDLLAPGHRAWRGAELSMHVNISPRHLLEPNFAASMADIAAEFGVRTECLVLEITEGLLIDQPDEALSMLTRCADHGFRIALDDFGTGYSSLAYLSKFPLSEIKIDRAFVLEMFTNSRSMKILETVCGLAETLNLQVIAEGLEDENQLRVIREMGCAMGQGYYFGRPVPLADAQAFLGVGVECAVGAR